MMKKQRNIVTFILIILTVIVVGSVYLLIDNTQKKNAYNSALVLVNEGKYEDAINQFIKLGDYKDSSDQIMNVKYIQALEFGEKKDYEKAIDLLQKLKNYNDSAEQIKNMKYKQAIEFEEKCEYDSAIALLTELGDYKDSQEKCDLDKEYKEKPWKKLISYIKKNGNCTENITMKNIFDEYVFSGYSIAFFPEERNAGTTWTLYLEEGCSDDFWYEFTSTTPEISIQCCTHFLYPQKKIEFTIYYEAKNGWGPINGKTYDCRGTLYKEIMIESYESGQEFASDQESLEYMDPSDNEWKKLDVKIGNLLPESPMDIMFEPLQTYLKEKSNISMSDLGFLYE